MSASLPFYGAVTVFNLDKSVSFPTGGLLLAVVHFTSVSSQKNAMMKYRTKIEDK